MWLFLTTSSITALILVIFLYKKWLFSYWKRKNLHYIPYDLPSRDPTSIAYDEGKKLGLKHVGCFKLYRPLYVPVDLDLMKLILIKNFDHFANRGNYVNEHADPLSGNLINLEDERWRWMRSKLTPTFTTGKMKTMFHTMVSSINGLMSILENHTDKNVPIEAMDAMSRYTIDVIGSCAFGIDCSAVNDTNSEFRKMGRQFTSLSWRTVFRVYVNRSLLKLVNFSEHSAEVKKFFINLTKDIVDYRDKNNVTRNDFVQLLIQLRDQGQVSEEGDSTVENDKVKSKTNHLSLTEMAAQCYTFFGAGFSTSSSTLSLCLFELALNQEIQNKLREEIKSVTRKHGELTYEAIMEMSYLDQVVNETLRKYPVARSLLRVCNKPMTVPGTNFVIEPGLKVLIPIFKIHRDSDYWPDPEKFDPDRFLPENKLGRHPMSFIPFGDGPRICIGFRFAYLQMKTGLAATISKFRLSLNEKTTLPVEYDPKQSFIAIKGGVWLNIHSL